MTTSTRTHPRDLPTPATIGEDAIRWFGDLRKDALAFAGGKGANLGELCSIGIAVPPGFVVGAPAFREFRRRSGLSEKLRQRLGEIDLDDPAGAEKISAAVRREIEAATVPEAIEMTVRKEYRRLCGNVTDCGVAVRSSATVEDNASASFAGMNGQVRMARRPAAPRIGTCHSGHPRCGAGCRDARDRGTEPVSPLPRTGQLTFADRDRIRARRPRRIAADRRNRLRPGRTGPPRAMKRNRPPPTG